MKFPEPHENLPRLQSTEQPADTKAKPEATPALMLPEDPFPEIDISAPWVANPKNQTPTPTGCPVYDALLGGTKSAYEVGILSNGPGNSILALQTACGVAKRGDIAVFFSWETPAFEPPILQNLVRSSLTGIPIHDFDFSMREEVGTYQVELVNTQLAQIKDKLLVYEMSQGQTGTGGIKEAMGRLTELQAKGLKPKLVVFDGLASLVGRFMLGNEVLDSNRHTVFATQAILAHQAALTFSTTVILTHQLNARVGRGWGTGTPTRYDAAENSSFGDVMDAVVCMGRPNSDGVSAIHVEKKFGKRNQVMARYGGEVAQFELLPTLVVGKKGGSSRRNAG